jgi:23S rRNA-/tRNA-specific pseudouridylate synthase
LRECFFVNLGQFNEQELQEQLKLLETFLLDIAVGRKFRAKRRTLLKQCRRIQEQLNDLLNPGSQIGEASQNTCRNCGLVDCEGNCWGFFSLKRKEVLDVEATKKHSVQSLTALPCNRSSFTSQKSKRKRLQNEKEVTEILQSGVFEPVSVFRDKITGIRVPPCFTRTLRCHTKGKWCGRLVAEVVKEEFKELSHVERLQQSLRYGLLQLNGTPLDAVSVAQRRLKGADILSRDLHWHEAPVFVPEEIGVTKVALPTALIESSTLKSSDAFIFVCDKPSSVPVHPAGPYFANTLTFLVEAQIGLPPRSLNPVHRTDRVTSGLTLCCTSPIVARYFHAAFSEGTVRKMYVARVKGKFPSERSEIAGAKPGTTWLEDLATVEVNAPVWTCDPANGVRTISTNGKESRSRFKLIKYNTATNTSLLLCRPLTGRNHQLRLHLSWIGFPIMYDIQYGGEPPEKDSTNDSIDLIQRAMGSDDGTESSSNVKKGCPICSDAEKNIEKFFSPAQLLSRGHSILLHALRYQVTFTRHGKEIATAEYSVKLPDWIENGDLQDRLDWLE